MRACVRNLALSLFLFVTLLKISNNSANFGARTSRFCVVVEWDVWNVGNSRNCRNAWNVRNFRNARNVKNVRRDR